MTHDQYQAWTDQQRQLMAAGKAVCYICGQHADCTCTACGEHVCDNHCVVANGDGLWYCDDCKPQDCHLCGQPDGSHELYCENDPAYQRHIDQQIDRMREER